MTIKIFIQLCIVIIFLGCQNTAEKVMSKEVFSDKTEYEKGDTLSILKILDFSQGVWEAKLYLSSDDKQSTFNRQLELKDVEIMKRMQKDWWVIYTGADIATLTSYIEFYKDNELLYKSGISFSEKEGFQNELYGWVEITDQGILKRYLNYFK